ncbi:MAG TPA: nucleotidyltransferase domain-containing protein [Blastocatellia bacterium]
MNTELLQALPANVTRVLTDFTSAAEQAFGADLRAIVLYGSAAEGRLRATSDVNLLLVLSRFEQANAARLSEPMRVGQTAINLTVMFLLESEIAAAAEAFAVKFADILQRRQVLYGADPFVNLVISRAAELGRLKQSLLNLTLRWREAFVARGLREEQLAAVIAEAAGPLRACAAALLALEGTPAASPKKALEQVAATLPNAGVDETALLGRITEARQTRLLPPGVAGTTLFQLIELAQAMQARAASLS